MSELQVYNKTIWEDSPSEETPINADNLNKIENQIEAVTNDVMANNLLSKLIYKGEVALLADLPATAQKVGDYYIVVEKGIPYVWNGTEFKAQVIIPEGGETTQSLGTLISSADSKATPDVDDIFGYSDSEDVANSNILKKLTWGNIRGSLATFFEGIFALVLHGHAIADITSLQTSLDAKADTNLVRPKNWIINGMFDVWQRGTSKVCMADTITYLADRFNTFIVSSTSSTTSRQAFTIGQTEVPNNPMYFHRSVVVSGNGIASRGNLSQGIEDVTKFSGKVVSVSFWAKANANKNIALELIQQFGTGGSAAIVGIGVQKFAITSTWQRFTKTITIPSVNGKTIGADNSLALNIYFDAGFNLNARTDSLGNQSGTFDIANVSLVEGSVAVECQNKPYAEGLEDCLRYFFPLVSLTDSIYAKVGVGFAQDTTNVTVIYYLPVAMRKNPVISTNDATKFWVSDGSNNLVLTGLTYESVNPSVVKLSASKTTSLTQFRPYLFERSGNSLGYIWADAEL